ncbi:MAG: 4-alpha-glucanotransferase [Magnetospirillum sp. WYHS-4]
MTDNTNLLDRLADLVGIRPSYHDIYGGFHETTAEAKQAILEAMGYAVGDEAARAATLTALEERPWRNWLEATTVARRPTAPSVALSLPSADRDRTLRWELALEDGSVRLGEFVPHQLALEDARRINGTWMERRRLVLPGDLPHGYHELAVDDGRHRSTGRLIVAPGRCYVPDWMDRGVRHWGLACHLYSLRRGDDWGVGDFSALRQLCQAGASLGAAAVGINPLHKLFLDWPEHASPYSPCSRLFLNPLYIDVTAIPGFRDCSNAMGRASQDEFMRRVAEARAKDHVDYTAVAALKLEMLENLHACFSSRSVQERKEYTAFRKTGGEILNRFVLYQGLRERFRGQPWSQWPECYRRPDSHESRNFAREQEARLDFHAWLQWLAETQLAAAADNGMTVGLYRDLAVGADPNGADAWMEPGLTARDYRFGAPPDAFNPLGQDWGMPPPHPVAMKETGYESFARMLRANMRHAGALRIDHAMSLLHLYWIRPGDKASKGAYVKYPFDDLLGVLALESQRNRCLVVGEDLGTVPDGFRARMEHEGVLSYRLFYFERWESGLFKRPETYPALALATATTHDLPTVAGHWRGADLELRRRLRLFKSEETLAADFRARETEREVLLAALRDQGLQPDGLSLSPDLDEDRLRALTVAVERFLARSPARLLMLNLDDLLIEADQLNLPGTIAEYPNWRRRLKATVREFAAAPYVRSVIREVVRERGEPS